MILEAVELRNWRNVREPRRVRFEQGLNLIVGPNEVGKSSLLEGVLRALLDRHTSRTAELRRIRPWGSTLAPEVTLWLRVGGRRLRIEKRFLSDPKSKVSIERSGRWELDHEGDRADQYVRRLLLEDTGRGASKAAQRGVAQALWFLQSDEALPRSWSRALEEGVSGLVDQVFSDPLEDVVAQRLRGELAAHLTPKGRLSSRSELKVLRDELSEKRAALAEREQDLQRLSHYFEELASLAAERERQNERRRGLETESESLRRTLEGAGEAEALLQQARENEEDARRQLAEARRLDDEMRGLERQIESSERKLAEAEEREAELRAGVREQRRLAERHARRWEDELQPRVQQERGQIADLRNKMRIEELEAEYSTLARRASRLGELDRALAEAASTLEAQPSIEPSDVAHARHLAGRVEILQGQLEASAIVVDLALEEGVNLRVRPDDRVGGVSTRLLITRPTELAIEGVGTLHLRSNDGALEELHDNRTRQEMQLAALLERSNCGSLDEMVERFEAADQARRRLDELNGRRQELLGDHDDGRELKRRRDEVARELEQMRRMAPQATLPGLGGWAEERTLDELREHEQRLAQFEREMAHEREAEQVAQQQCLERNEQLNATGQRLAGLRSTSRLLGEQLARLEKQRQRRAGGEEALEQAGVQLARSEQAVAEAQRLFRERVEEPGSQLRKCEAQLLSLRDQLASTEAQLSDRRGRVEEVSSLGLHATVDELRVEVAERTSVVEQLGRRVEALRLLDALWNHHGSQQVAQVVTPVRQLVDRWWSQLADGRYEGVEVGEDLLPSGVRASGHDDVQPLDSLSHGAFEQVAVLVRLALGVLLSQEERQLVVLDDGLVNSDRVRMERLAPILEEVSRHCQLVIATCRPEDYEALDVLSDLDLHRVELAFAGRWQPRVVEATAGIE